jgi:rhodanese-related sulfurtransferase
MKKRLFAVLMAALTLSACTAEKTSENAGYMCIAPQDAKKIMDTQEGYVILDTRTEEEYETGHIPGAIVISHEQIKEKAEQVLTDKDQLILVYCRSGRRSKLAAQDLVDLGYTNVKEFGGIIDWPYEVE